MPKEDENLNPDDDDIKNKDNNEGDDTKDDDDDDIIPDNIPKDIVEKVVEKRLKKIKEKLDGAFKKRDEALRRAAELEQKVREAEVERLKAAGREREALELQLEEVKARAEAAEKRNTELARDMQVRNALSNFQFRNTKAVEIAYRDIVENLVKNEAGIWVNKDGSSLESTVKAFCEDPDNAFLMKPKQNSGGGTSSPAGGVPQDKPKSLLSMSNDEIIRLAKEGKLKR